MMGEVRTMPKGALWTAGTSDCHPPPHPPPVGPGLRLPAISPAQVKSLNAFYRRRAAVAFSVAGRGATIAASWPLPSQDVSARCRLDITVDGVPGAVILSRPLIEAAIAALDPIKGLDRLEPPHVALLLELALSDALSMLEAGLGARLAIVSVHAEEDVGRNRAASLAFDITVDGIGSSCGELLLQPGPAIMFAQFLDRCAFKPHPPPQAEGKSIHPPPLAGEGRAGAAIELPLAVCVRAAAATFAVGEIATLSPGDVVMVDRSREQMRAAVAVIAEHLVAPVELTAAGAQIAARPTRAHGSLWEWSMENGGQVGGRHSTKNRSRRYSGEAPVRAGARRAVA
jgi:hypothetical protein